MTAASTRKKRAIVVGAGFGGIAAAQALSAHFEEVCLVDRDTLPESPELRAGVPQSAHVHTLLVRGQRDLCALFPRLRERLIEAGAQELDLWQEIAILRRSGWSPREQAPDKVIFGSRALLEWCVRKELERHPNVRIISDCRVSNLLWHAGGGVRGVRVAGPVAELEADLVVDAAGRNTPFLKWFAEHGLSAPETDVVDPKAGYASRWFAAPAREELPREWWWKGLWVYASPPKYPYTGVLFPIEGQRWIVTLIGNNGRVPPVEEEAFAEALRQVRSPVLAEMVAHATPLTKVFGYHSLANVRRHYEDWSELPSGFIAVGDAACTLNAFYGQGMSCAASSARVLAKWLERGARSPRAFFRAQARANAPAWTLSAGVDAKALALADNSLSGAAKLTSAYFEALLAAAQHSRQVRVRFIQVINLMKPPVALFYPDVMARVAYHRLRQRNTEEVSERAHGSRPDAVLGAG